VKVGDAIVDEDSFVEIQDDVFLGFGTVVLPNVVIGRGAVIGANSVVATDIPPFTVAAGAPAKVIRSRKLPE
jgi:acetyltransferase-like isoleucine patch superfamily enzyme